jgi:hypothetical protein
MDIVVTLRPAEIKALVRQADEERRSPADQAGYLLARALSAPVGNQMARSSDARSEPVAA